MSSANKGQQIPGQDQDLEIFREYFDFPDQPTSEVVVQGYAQNTNQIDVQQSTGEQVIQENDVQFDPNQFFVNQGNYVALSGTNGHNYGNVVEPYPNLATNGDQFFDISGDNSNTLYDQSQSQGTPINTANYISYNNESLRNSCSIDTVVDSVAANQVITRGQSKIKPSKDDPAYLAYREKNNKAVRESRKKKKKSMEECESKCQHQKEKIRSLKEAVAKYKDAAETEQRRVQIVVETNRHLVKTNRELVNRLKQYEKNQSNPVGNDIVAYPSGSGFGNEASQDLEGHIPMGSLSGVTFWRG